MLSQQFFQWKWATPLFFLLLFLPFSPWLDMALARHFYPFSSNRYFDFMYHYGESFGFVLFGAATFLSLFRRYRRQALVVVLTIGLGAGIVVNALCKGYLGRPRPKQLCEFHIDDVEQQFVYRPVWRPNLKADRFPQKSFPSGHVAMGFSPLALVVVFRKKRLLRQGAIILTFFWGGSLMVTRVVMGGHFLSDVIVSPCIMWWIALGSNQFLHWAERSNIKVLKDFLADSKQPISIR